MSIDRKKLRWNGWGWNEAPDVLGEHADKVWAWVEKTMGISPLPNTPSIDPKEINFPAIRLSAEDVAELKAMLGEEKVCTDDYERLYHARGRSFHDLLWLRSGKVDTFPDAVIYPESTEEVLHLLEFADKNNIAIVPFGGGSSVVGGVTARAAQNQKAVITLDTTHMDQVIEIDETALVARVQAGVYGPQLEEALQEKGFTLSHYPQSFEFSTLGGWIAPRGSGHQSNKYGSAVKWFVGAQVVTPQGIWETEGFPGSAAGPQMPDIVLGSEGALGVITEALVKIHRVPEIKDYRGYIFMDFNAAVKATREMLQEDVHTAMIRLSDRAETRFYTALQLGGEEPDPSLTLCAMLVGLEGEKAEATLALNRSQEIIQKNGGIHMGESLGESWYEGRFETPYLRYPLVERGLAVDTLETCTRWSNIIPLHDIVTEAITKALDENAVQEGASGIVMSHVSHSYLDGASLYFTYVYPRDPDREIEQWQAIKKAASDAILAHGGTISHHHGVGEDHLPWIGQEKGPFGSGVLKAIKAQLDPQGIMNPGKLIQ